MKKLSLAILAATTLMSGSALADNHTVSVGYAQSKMDNFKDFRGVNVQYRYEWDSAFSAIGSFSYMSGDEDYADYSSGMGSLKAHTEIKYTSLLVGPAYRINKYVSVYALGGLAYVKGDEDWKWGDVWGRTSHREKDSYDSTSFAWGAGVQVNPTQDLAISLGYEGTTADFGKDFSINGFNINVGYRF